MAKHKKIEAGDKFMLNCGIEVVVLEYKDSRNVIVESEGQIMITTNTALRSGSMAVVLEDKGVFRKMRAKRSKKDLNIGDRFETNNCGVITVTGVNSDNTCNILFENTGHTRDNVPKCNVFSGMIRDNSTAAIRSIYAHCVGDRHYSEQWGWYEVTQVIDAHNIQIVWDDNSSEQKTTARSISTGRVSKRIQYSQELSPKGHYVYMAWVDNELHYIGNGKGDRYTHCNSGTSTSYLLNKGHFQGKRYIIQIFEDGLTKQEAVDLESKLIKELNPICNIAGR